MSNETTNPVLKWILIIVACVSILVAIFLALYSVSEYRAAWKLRARGFTVYFVKLDDMILHRPITVANNGQNITLDDCRLICQLPHLIRLGFVGGNMSGLNLGEIGNCPRFEIFLCQDVTQFPADEIRKLATCPLNSLVLSNVDLEDSDLENLMGLTKLEFINLGGNVGITDASFEYLEKIASLKNLFLSETSVTQEGIEEFKKKRPDVEIHF